jgi:hypothetical protein
LFSQTDPQCFHNVNTHTGNDSGHAHTRTIPLLLPQAPTPNPIVCKNCTERLGLFSQTDPQYGEGDTAPIPFSCYLQPLPPVHRVHTHTHTTSLFHARQHLPLLIHLGILHEPALLLAAQALQGLPPDASYDDVGLASSDVGLASGQATEGRLGERAGTGGRMDRVGDTAGLPRCATSA